MTYYVFLLGSYDSCYVGPFDSKQEAEDYKATSVEREIDAHVVTKEEYLDDVAEYSEIPCYDPFDYVLPDYDDYDGQPDEAQEWEDFGEVYSDIYPLYDGGEY